MLVKVESDSNMCYSAHLFTVEILLKIMIFLSLLFYIVVFVLYSIIFNAAWFNFQFIFNKNIQRYDVEYFYTDEGHLTGCKSF